METRKKVFLIIAFVTLLPKSSFADQYEEDNYGVKYADECEVCKITVRELQDKLEETGKSEDIIDTGYHIDRKQAPKKTKYKKSQLRLIETLENACEGILHYKVHKERTDSSRFDKSESQTFSTLHGLVNKGVKVDLGIPYELWDKPSAEITRLKSQCEELLEKYETEIEDWYNSDVSVDSLQKYLCEDIVLHNHDKSCLSQSVAAPSSKTEL